MSLKDSNGQTALDLARMRNYTDVVNLLRKYEAPESSRKGI
jgi:ankyrin repeat protein